MTECPSCEDEFQRLGTHWNYNNSHRPSFTEEQHEILTGLLMGDGSVDKGSKNSNISVTMTNKRYLEYLDREFDCLSRGVKHIATPKESAKQMRDKGFRPNAKAENYKNLYRWESRSHPEINKYKDWYASGSKRYPKELKLTPTTLKHWYCGDGTWRNKNYHSHIEIAILNESNRTDIIDKIFINSKLPTPSNYVTNEKSCGLQFTVSQSKMLWGYMGEPLPGFEYKFPDNHDTLVEIYDERDEPTQL